VKPKTGEAKAGDAGNLVCRIQPVIPKAWEPFECSTSFSSHPELMPLSNNQCGEAHLLKTDLLKVHRPSVDASVKPTDERVLDVRVGTDKYPVLQSV
jgi:hypothetical protein